MAQQVYATRFRRKFGVEDEMSRYVGALYEMLASVLGQDKLVLRAGKVNALKMMRSQNLPDRLCGLQRLVLEDPTLERATTRAQQRKALAEVEEAMADVIAQRHAEDSIERRVNEKMTERHQEYVKDLKLEALRESGGPETPSSQAKLDELTALSQRSLAASALQQLRPQTLRDVVGQEHAVRALLAKISSPFPQHAILYGPPGVGKTTVARLVLEVAKLRPHTPFAKDAPFVEASGPTLRWDPRETVNPLLGSVHDPIYQGSRREFADAGVPEPKLGLVTRAHGGVLFIDEIGEMEPALQFRLLKVLEDKRVTFESSYFDETAPNVPEYVKRLFREGAPADFILIGATTREPDDIDPAIRSRCAEIFFSPLTQHQILAIVEGAVKRLGVKAARAVPALIASYTIEGRKAVQIVADAYGQALYRIYPGNRRAEKTKSPRIVEDDVRAVVRAGPAGAAHAGEGPRPARGGEELRPGRAAPFGQHHRDRSGGVSRRAGGQGPDSLQRHRGHDGQGLGVQRDERFARRDRHRHQRLRPAHQHRRRREHRRSVGRPCDLSRALLRRHQDGAAAGRRGHRRAVDSRQGARRRRRRREALRRAPSRHEDRLGSEGERARG